MKDSYIIGGTVAVAMIAWGFCWFGCEGPVRSKAMSSVVAADSAAQTGRPLSKSVRFLTRNPSPTFKPTGEQKKLQSLEDQANSEMERGDYAAAESGVRTLIALDHDAPMRYFALGDVLFQEGKREESRLAYKKYIEGTGGYMGDIVLLTRYGDLAYEAGDTTSAREAYSRVLSTRNLQSFPIELPDPNEVKSLNRLRAIAESNSAPFFRGQPEKYLNAAQDAVESDPTCSLAHFTLSDALYVCGQIADAKAELDKGLRLSSKQDAERMKPFIRRIKRFDHWGYRSVGTINRDGTLTITYEKISPPNNIRFIKSTESKPKGPVRP